MENTLRELGLKRTEIIVLLAIISVVIVLIYPLFQKNVGTGSQYTCMNQVRHIMGAIQMYTQDNQKLYPGHPWISNISPYLHGSSAFSCPSDSQAKTTTVCSYGYNGSLIHLDGSGITESSIRIPDKVGVICDASPSRSLIKDNYIPGAALLTDEEHDAIPVARHNGGIVVGFCDGHVEWLAGGFIPADISSPLTRAFYLCYQSGTSRLTGGGLPQSSQLTRSDYKYPNAIDIGGEYSTWPLLSEMADLWKYQAMDYSAAEANYPGANGEYTLETESTYLAGIWNQWSDFLWGTVDEGVGLARMTDSKGVHFPIECENTVIGHDALVIIIAKNSKIQPNKIGGLKTIRNTSSPNNGWYCCSTAIIAAWFSENDGSSDNKWHAYKYLPTCAITGQFARYIGLPIDKVCIQVAANRLGEATNKFAGKGIRFKPKPGYDNETPVAVDDWTMVDEVAKDPYGIGFCSSAFADLDRVQCLGIYDPTSPNGPTSGQYYWPNADAKHRTCLPNPFPGGGPNAHIPYQWPPTLVRTLRVRSAGEGTRLVKDIMKGNKLAHGPLFACSYW